MLVYVTSNKQLYGACQKLSCLLNLKKLSGAEEQGKTSLSTLNGHLPWGCGNGIC
jgi:hypothetical protein